MKLQALFLIVLFGALVSAHHILVVSDRTPEKTHSTFLSWLETEGHTVSHASAKNAPSLALYGEYQYDALFIFSNDIDAEQDDLIDFVKSGRSLFVATSKPKASIEDLLGELELSVGEQVNITARQVLPLPTIVGEAGEEVSYFGTTLGKDDLVATYYPLLKEASDSEDALLVALQTYTDARILVSGSTRIMSNRQMKLPGNAKLMQGAVQWLLKQRGDLRITEIEHVDITTGETNPEIVTVKDDLQVSFGIEERVNGEWVPYISSDVQVEFTMLDPRLRVNMACDAQGRYTTTFKCPDVYGIYKIIAKHHAAGYRPIEAIKTVQVRPFRHNQFARFIPCAYPYYIAAFAALAGLLVFSSLFLTLKEKAE